MNAIPSDQAAFDVGPKTLEMFARMTKDAKTIFWNGPMGVFETKPFDAGTLGVAKLLAASSGFTVVGGGESVEAVKAAGLAGRSRTSRPAAARPWTSSPASRCRASTRCDEALTP